MRTFLILLLLAACNPAPPEPPMVRANAPASSVGSNYMRLDGVHGLCTPQPDGMELCCPTPTGSKPCTVQVPW